MSLVLYDTDGDLRQLVVPGPRSQLNIENHGGEEFRIVLNDVDQSVVVLQNRNTKELELVDRDWWYRKLQEEEGDEGRFNSVLDLRGSYKGHDVHMKCPNCGVPIINPSPSNNEYGAKDSFIHHSYFKLLETNIEAKLPNSVFSQGYYGHFFKELKLLGRGSRGSVYLVQHILNDYELGQFALKKITIGDDPKWLLNVLNEVHMLVNISVNNVNLVNYNHVWLEVDSINEFGPRVPCAFILQQYCSGGNLEDFINWLKEPKLTVKEMKKFKVRKIQGRLLNEVEILQMFKDIVNGVHELHKNHIIHRDLKPSNCLLSEIYKFPNFPKNLESDVDNIPTILIGDFGESQLEGEKRNASGSTGTLEYCAPELFELKEFSKKTDVYSLGMILYHMYFGNLPFKSSGFDIDSLRQEINQFETILDQLPIRNEVNPGLYELIKDMTRKDPSKRLNTEEILQKIEQFRSIVNVNSTKKYHHRHQPPHPHQGKRISISDAKEEEDDDEINLESLPTLKTSEWHNYLIHAGQLFVLSLLIQKDESWGTLLKYIIVFINGVTWMTPSIKIRGSVILLTIFMIMIMKY